MNVTLQYKEILTALRSHLRDRCNMVAPDDDASTFRWELEEDGTVTVEVFDIELVPPKPQAGWEAPAAERPAPATARRAGRPGRPAEADISEDDVHDLLAREKQVLAPPPRDPGNRPRNRFLTTQVAETIEDFGKDPSDIQDEIG